MSEDRALRKVRSRLEKALEADRTDEALQCLVQLRQAEPENARWPHKQGDLLRQQNRISEAVQCYASAVGLYADQGFLVRAIAMAKAVVVMDPSRIDLLARVDPEAAKLVRSGKGLPRRPVMLDDAPYAPLPPADAPHVSIKPLPPMRGQAPSPPAAGQGKPARPPAPRIPGQAARSLAPPPPVPRGAAAAPPHARELERDVARAGRPPGSRGARELELSEAARHAQASRGGYAAVHGGRELGELELNAPRGRGRELELDEAARDAQVPRGGPSGAQHDVRELGELELDAPRGGNAAGQGAREFGLDAPRRGGLAFGQGMRELDPEAAQAFDGFRELGPQAQAGGGAAFGQGFRELDPEAPVGATPARGGAFGQGFRELDPEAPVGATPARGGAFGQGFRELDAASDTARSRAVPPPFVPPKPAANAAKAPPLVNSSQRRPPPPPSLEAARGASPPPPGHAVRAPGANAQPADEAARARAAVGGASPGRAAARIAAPPTAASATQPSSSARQAPRLDAARAAAAAAAAASKAWDDLGLPDDLDDAPLASASPLGAEPPPSAARDQHLARAATSAGKTHAAPNVSAANDAQRGQVASAARGANEVRGKREVLLRLSIPPAVDELEQGAASGVPDSLAQDPQAAAREPPFATAAHAEAPAAADPRFGELDLAERDAAARVESPRPKPVPRQALAKLPLFPLFADLPEALLDRLIAGAELIELAHGAHALHSGQTNAALFAVLAGSVNLVVPGQAFELTLGEGDVFGEACLFDGEKAPADVTAVGNLLALRVPRAVLLEVVREHPPLEGQLLQLLTRRLLGNLLQVSPLFGDFDAPGKLELARLFEVRRAAPGTVLAGLGKKLDSLYISLTGSLRVSQPGAPESFAPPGSMFGQKTLLAQEPSQVDVIAHVDMILLRLPFAQFTRLAMQYPTVLERLDELSTSEVARVTM